MYMTKLTISRFNYRLLWLENELFIWASALSSRLFIVRTGMAGLLYWKQIRPVWSCKSLLERTTLLRSKLWPKGVMAPAVAPSAYQRCPVSFKHLAACKWLQLELGRGAVGWVHCVTNPQCDWYCSSALPKLEQGLQKTRLNWNKPATYEQEEETKGSVLALFVC